MPPNREQMWYCHYCHTEMHPHMVPDPHCSSCSATCLELIENPQDHPRAWHTVRPDDDGTFDDFAALLQDALPDPMPNRVGGFNVSINRSSPPGENARSFPFRAPGQTGVGPDRVTRLSDYTTGGTMRNLSWMDLLSLLTQHNMGRRDPGASDPFAIFPGTSREGPVDRLGDYALSQEALDAIIVGLQERSDAHRPLPVTEEVIERLNRQVLVEGSPLLEKVCVVCIDKFSLQTEDPDEQVVITLPCAHYYHSPCILKWLKEDNKCPTCRSPVVPQPGSTQGSNSNPASGPGPSTSTSVPPQPTSPTIPENVDRNGSGGGAFSLLRALVRGGTGTMPSSSRSGPDSDQSFPGSWSWPPNDGPEPRPPQAGGPTDERNSYNYGSHQHRRDTGRDERGDRTGQRRNSTRPGT